MKEGMSNYTPLVLEYSNIMFYFGENADSLLLSYRQQYLHIFSNALIFRLSIIVEK